MGWDTNVFGMVFFLHTEHYENFGSVHQAACFKSESTQTISVTSSVRGLYWRLACELQFGPIDPQWHLFHINRKLKFISFVRNGLSYIWSRRDRTHNMDPIKI